MRTGAYEAHHGAEGVAQLARTLGREAARRGDAAANPIRELAGGDPDAIESETVFAAARAGDPASKAIIEESISSAGRAIVTMALVLNPELVVIRGGVANAGDALVDRFAADSARWRAYLRDSRHPHSPNVEYSSARSATRSTNSSRGCSTTCTRLLEREPAQCVARRLPVVPKLQEP